MKLIDLLVKELPKRGGWPVNVSYIAQDEGSATWGFRYKSEKDPDDEWMDCSDSGYEIRIGYIGDADDCNTSVVTRAQYDSAIAASEGWIEWNGGDCPVDSDAIVEVRYRKPSPYQFNNDRAGDFTWSHDGFGGDIIAYRLHNPDAKYRSNEDRLEQDLNECIGQDVDVPEWNGEGLPPVGMHCKIADPDGVLMYGQGESGEVIAHVENTAVIRMSYGLGCFEARFLRPASSEAEKARKAAETAMRTCLAGTGAGITPMAAKGIYDAIAAGKIPGVKLEVK